MERTGIAICLGMGLLLVGCPRVDSPPDPADETGNKASTPVSESDSVKPGSAKPDAEPKLDVEPEPAAPKPTHSAEKIEAAKELATNLGIAVEEDGKGNVIRIDAANRNWPTSEQMKAILVFPTLESLTFEGPDVTDELAPQIAQRPRPTLRQKSRCRRSLARFFTPLPSDRSEALRGRINCTELARQSSSSRDPVESDSRNSL